MSLADIRNNVVAKEAAAVAQQNADATGLTAEQVSDNGRGRTSYLRQDLADKRANRQATQAKESAKLAANYDSTKGTRGDYDAQQAYNDTGYDSGGNAMSANDWYNSVSQRYAESQAKIKDLTEQIDSKSRRDYYSTSAKENPDAEVNKDAAAAEVEALKQQLAQLTEQDSKLEMALGAARRYKEASDAKEQEDELKAQFNSRMQQNGYSTVKVYNEAMAAAEAVKKAKEEAEKRLEEAKKADYYKLEKTPVANGSTWRYVVDKEKRDSAIERAGRELAELTRRFEEANKFAGYAGNFITRDLGTAQRVNQGWQMEQERFANARAKAENQAAQVDVDQQAYALEHRMGLEMQTHPTEEWSQDQRNQFYVRLRLYGEDNAASYAAGVNSAINDAKTQGDREAIAEIAANAAGKTSSKLGQDIVGVGMQVASLPSRVVSYLQKLESINQTGYYTGRDHLNYGDVADIYTQARAGQMNKDYGTADLGILGEKGVGDLYQLVPSMAQSILYGNIAGSAGTLAAFFFQAADQSFDEAKARGASDQNALVYSFLSGAAEAATEVFSVEQLLKGDWANSFAKQLAKQFGTEMSEEGMSAVLGVVNDKIAAMSTGEKTEIQNKIDSLVANGMSRADAEKQVWKETVSDIAWESLAGGLSGFGSGVVMGGPQAAVNSARNRLYEIQQQRAAERAAAQTPSAPTASQPQTQPQNLLYNAMQSASKPAPVQTAQGAAGQQEAPASEITQSQTHEAAQTVKPVESSTAEPTPQEKTSTERYREIQSRIDEINDQLDNATDKAEIDRLYQEGEALWQEARQLESQPEVVQDQRVQNGEVSKGFGTAENHIDNRTAESVSKPSVKAFQFDHPELHQYFVDVARELIADVEYAEWLTKAHMYELGSAIESGPIRELMDQGLTKPEIIKALQDIIANNGQENYAKAKKVERVLSQMMTDGWLDLKRQNHDAVPEYIAAKDAINGAFKSDSWEKYLADHELVLALGEVTEEQLRQDWERTHPQEEAAAVTEPETATAEAEEASAEPATVQPVEAESAGEEQSAGTIPASEQTTAERTNGQGPERERNMAANLRQNEKAEPALRQDFDENRELYTQLTNAEVTQKAEAILAEGYEAARNAVQQAVGQSKAGMKLAPEMAVAGYHVATEMAKRGDIAAARELCSDIAAELTYSGQLSQIGRLIIAADPSIRIKTVDKIVDKINDSMSERQKAKNKKRSGGKESARKANEAAQAAQKQAAAMVANALSGGDTFNFPDAAAKEVAGSIKAQIKRALSPQKPRNALDTFVGYVKKFAREKINVGKKSKPITSTELLREVVNNEELFMEVYEKAQAEFMGEDSTGYREFVEDYLNSPVGIDGTGDAKNKIFMRAIVESATATNENARTIRTQAALGVPKGEIANRIADALIQETGATGGIAESIRGSAQAYVNEIINSDEKTGDARAEREVTSIMQAIGVKFREMAVQNKAAKDAVRRDIANMLATEYALSPDSAEKIAQYVANEYDRQLSDAMAKEVEKRFAPKEKRAKAEAKALTQQLTEAINLGTFSSDYATEAVNKIFGVDGNISVSDEALQRYAEADTEEAQNEALDAIEQEIADQIPATFRDKFTALRYLNMLGNLKTQARNIVGNTAMMAATNVKYLTQHVGELAASLVTGGKYQGNTALNTSKELRQQAADDFAAHVDEIKGDAKYSDVGREAAKGVQDKRTIFGAKTGNALYDNTVGRVGKGLEAARKATNWAMDVGDEIFLRQVYVRSFAGWMKAHGVTDVNSASAEQVSAAREFAKKEAQEATFHDSNQFSEFVSSIDANWDKGHSERVNKIGAAAKMITQGIMPFRKTPANVAVRAVEYSPVGAIGTIYEAIQAKKGNASTADVINSAAKNLTGTALFGIGMLMAAAGRARASGDEEDKELTAFQKMGGAMDYSVKVGDKYISLSQLAPMAIPFFMGVKLKELLEYNDNLFSADSIGDLLGVVSDPMLEMSMLSGVNDLLNDISSLNGDTDALPSLVTNAALSYLTQGLTNTLLGQLEQMSERNRQTTYSDTKSADATGFDRFLGEYQYKVSKATAKIPGIDYNQQDYVDAWGRTQSNGSAGERAFNALLNPTYTSKDRSTKVDAELERLHSENRDKEGFPDVFPKKRSRSDVIGDGVVMTPDEYLEYEKTSGQKKLELVSQFMDSSEYKGLTDEQRADVISNLYSFADNLALRSTRESYGIKKENDTYSLLSGKDKPGTASDIPALKEKNAGEYIAFDTLYKGAVKSGDYSTIDNLLYRYSKLNENTRAVVDAKKPDDLSALLKFRDSGASAKDYYAIKDSIGEEQWNMDVNSASGSHVRLAGLGSADIPDDKKDTLVESGAFKLSSTAKNAYGVLRNAGLKPEQISEWFENADWYASGTGKEAKADGSLNAYEVAVAISKMSGLDDSQREALYQQFKSALQNPGSPYDTWKNYSYRATLGRAGNYGRTVGRESAPKSGNVLYDYYAERQRTG